MNKSCNNCHQSFEIFPEDQNFYGRFQVPEPTWCPECRVIRRNIWRNERKLYKRKCDMCSEQFIFFYPEGTPFPVYCRDCWLSDKWDPKKYAQDYDFSKPFFEQWYELFKKVPRVGVIKQGMSVNSEYTNRITDARNCYLVYATTKVENSRYGTYLNGSKECYDCHNVFNSELCSNSIDCEKCYNTHFAQEAIECRDSMFLYNCRNCSDCFGCVNVRNGKYMMWNEQFSKEKYARWLEEFFAQGESAFTEAEQKLAEMRNKAIAPSMITYLSKDSSGNWIENAKRATYCFNVKNVEDVRYCQNVFDAKDCMDYSQWGNQSEMIYECASVGIQCANVKFSNECWNQLRDAEYCMNCHNSHDLFGCIGLRNSEYCILNKQYDKASFDELKTRIIARMRDDGEYGEFFPMNLSPFAYNETCALELHNISKSEAEKMGYLWRDEERRNNQTSEGVAACAHDGNCDHLCTYAFRILDADLEYYARFRFPRPKLCPNCRHFERLAKRNPLKLWPRQCAKCAKEIETSYAPDRPETVYCIECYQAEIV